jgi:hypothetical protein
MSKTHRSVGDFFGAEKCAVKHFGGNRKGNTEI